MLRTCFLSVAIFCSQSIFAGVTIDGTRIIFPSNAKSISVQLRNGFSTPALVQTWIDNGDIDQIPNADQIPFVLTPPLSRVEPNKGQIIRIIPTGSPSLPQDRESLFWFNMSANTAYASIKAKYNQLTKEINLNNPTPYFITITQMDFQSKSEHMEYSQAVMLKPFSQQAVDKLTVNFSPEKFSYQIVNDLGGNQDFETKFD